MRIDLDFTAYLKSLTPNPVEQNKLAEDYSTSPAVMFVRRSGFTDLFLNGGIGLTTTEYDVEVYGTDVDAVDTLVETLRPPLNGFMGAMGQTTVLGGFVEEHSDDYTSKVELNTDEGLHVQTFAVKLIHY